MALTLVTAPTSDPVSLAEVKEHLRITSTDEDALITSLVGSAKESGETITGRALITQTWDLSLDSFPQVIDIPKPPLQSVTSITYIDTDGATQTLASTEYTVDTKTEPGRIVPAYGKSWPSTRDIVNAVTVRFVAGYGNATAVPKSLKQAMLMHIEHMFGNRGTVAIGNIVNEIPLTMQSLYSMHRVYRF